MIRAVAAVTHRLGRVGLFAAGLVLSTISCAEDEPDCLPVLILPATEVTVRRTQGDFQGERVTLRVESNDGRSAEMPCTMPPRFESVSRTSDLRVYVRTGDQGAIVVRIIHDQQRTTLFTLSLRRSDGTVWSKTDVKPSYTFSGCGGEVTRAEWRVD